MAATRRRPRLRQVWEALQNYPEAQGDVWDAPCGSGRSMIAREDERWLRGKEIQDAGVDWKAGGRGGAVRVRATESPGKVE